MLFSQLVEIRDPEPHAAPLNMAIDEVLLRFVEQPTLRVYRWQRSALSFGYFGKIAEIEALAEGIEVVRRWTGGGIVEHGNDVTYTLLLPLGHKLSTCRAPESYRRIHEAVADWLRTEGRAVDVAPATVAKVSDACFSNPVQHDLIEAGAKVAGAAQRRTRWGLLHQGSIQGAGLSTHSGERLAGAFSAEVQSIEISAEIRCAAESLVREKYGTTAWLRKF